MTKLRQIMQEIKKQRELEKLFYEEMSKEIEEGNTLAEQIVQLKSEIQKLKKGFNNQYISIKSYQEDLKSAGEIIEQWVDLVCRRGACPECEECIYGDIKKKTDQFLGRIREIG